MRYVIIIFDAQSKYLRVESESIDKKCNTALRIGNLGSLVLISLLPLIIIIINATIIIIRDHTCIIVLLIGIVVVSIYFIN